MLFPRIFKILNSRKFKYGIVLILFFIIVPCFNVWSQSNEFQPKNGLIAGVSISSYGLGIDFKKPISQKTVFRVGTNYFGYNYPLEKLDNELHGNAKLNLGGISFGLEYSFTGFLYVTGGITYNMVQLKIDGTVAESVFIGDIEMYPDEIGTLDLLLSPGNRINPYLGIGVGKNIPLKHKISFAVEVGFIYQGKLQIDLKTTGMLEPTDNEEQETIIENNISALAFYPLISFKLIYKFD